MSFQNVNRAKQLIDFDGYGMTDIDAIIDGNGRYFVILEVKHALTPIPEGQRLCIERAVDAFQRSGKRAIALVVEHYEDDTEKPIHIGDCVIRTAYRGGLWQDVKAYGITVTEALQKIATKWKHYSRSARKRPRPQ